MIEVVEPQGRLMKVMGRRRGHVGNAMVVDDFGDLGILDAVNGLSHLVVVDENEHVAFPHALDEGGGSMPYSSNSMALSAGSSPRRTGTYVFSESVMFLRLA